VAERGEWREEKQGFRQETEEKMLVPSVCMDQMDRHMIAMELLMEKSIEAKRLLKFYETFEMGAERCRSYSKSLLWPTKECMSNNREESVEKTEGFSKERLCGHSR
jgi:hypothetical protein